MGNSSNVWQARSSVVTFSSIKNQELYFDQILESCKVLIKRTERFAKTAVGWLIREISSKDRSQATYFIEQHLGLFSKESLENTIKYYPSAEKKKFRETFKRQRQSSA